MVLFLVRLSSFADINMTGAATRVQATIALAITSGSKLYFEEKTKAAGAVGNVPYKKANLVRDTVSLALCTKGMS